MDDFSANNEDYLPHEQIKFKKLSKEEYKKELKKIFSQNRLIVSPRFKKVSKVICNQYNKEHTNKIFLQSELSIAGCQSVFSRLTVAANTLRKLKLNEIIVN